LYKSKVLHSSDASLYCMPSLEEDRPMKSEEEMMKDIEDIQRKAYEEGFASGEKAGFAEGEHKAAVLIKGLEKIIEDVALFKENLVRDMECQVVDLAITIAKKIIAEEINTRPEIIVTVVKEALKKLQRMGTITIKINPALYDLFMKKKSEVIDIHEDIIFDVNANISLTGPLVISQTEEVVTDIDGLMSNIMEDMNKVKVQSSLPVTAQGSAETDHAMKTADE